MRITWIVILLVVTIACNQNKDFKTESGTEVTVFESGDEALVPDSILLVSMKLETGGGEVLMESSEDKPLPIRYSDTIQAGDLQEVVNKLHVGDSVYFETTVTNLFEETYRSPIPPNIDSTDIVKINMKVFDQMSREAFTAYNQKKQEEMRAEQEAMMKEKATADIDSIDSYLAEQNIDAQVSESGLRYVITEEGSGPTADAGDVVKVHYTGKLLSGEQFDTSLDRGQPLEFPLGQGRVIPGWDEGIGYIKEGGKGTLYIPSTLAYGPNSPSPKIPPYSILVFDVEVVEVQEADGAQ